MNISTHLRALRRLAGLAVLFPVTLFLGMVNFRPGTVGLCRSARNSRFCARLLLRALGVELKVEGNVPDSFCGVVVSNHLGYLDILVHASLLPLRFAAKSDIRCWPLLGGYLALFRPIWIDRRRRVRAARSVAELVLSLGSGVAPIVYPEGTSSDGTRGVLPFRTTAFEPAAAGNWPVLPLATRYPELLRSSIRRGPAAMEPVESCRFGPPLLNRQRPEIGRFCRWRPGIRIGAWPGSVRIPFFPTSSGCSAAGESKWRWWSWSRSFPGPERVAGRWRSAAAGRSKTPLSGKVTERCLKKVSDKL